jgi:cell division septation protein DedD
VTSRARQTLLALAAAAALAATGCGSSAEEPAKRGKGLPQSSVDALDRRLDEVQRRYDDGVDNGNVGACEDIEGDSFQGDGGIDEIVSGLPQDVDPELRTALERSIERVRELTGDCAEQAAANPPQPVPEPEPVPVEPVPEETVPEETTPEKTKPEKTTPKPKPKPEPKPEPSPAPPPADEGGGLEDRLVPPGQDGGVPAPAPQGRQGKAQRRQPDKGGADR